MTCNLSDPKDFEGNTPLDSSTFWQFSYISCDDPVISFETGSTSTTTDFTAVNAAFSFLVLITLVLHVLIQWFFGVKGKETLYNKIQGNNSVDGKREYHD